MLACLLVCCFICLLAAAFLLCLLALSVYFLACLFACWFAHAYSLCLLVYLSITLVKHQLTCTLLATELKTISSLFYFLGKRERRQHWWGLCEFSAWTWRNIASWKSQHSSTRHINNSLTLTLTSGQRGLGRGGGNSMWKRAGMLVEKLQITSKRVIQKWARWYTILPLKDP